MTDPFCPFLRRGLLDVASGGLVRIQIVFCIPRGLCPMGLENEDQSRRDYAQPYPHQWAEMLREELGKGASITTVSLDKDPPRDLHCKPHAV